VAVVGMDRLRRERSSADLVEGHLSVTIATTAAYGEIPPAVTVVEENSSGSTRSDRPRSGRACGVRVRRDAARTAGH